MVIGLYTMNDIKSFFMRRFGVGDSIETIIENGSENLRLRYKIVALDRDGAICTLLEEEWIRSNRSIMTINNESEFKRFIHKDYFKYFRYVF